MENLHRRANRVVVKIKGINYQQRISLLRLPTLSCRRTRGSVIQIYKILTETYATKLTSRLSGTKSRVTRGNQSKTFFKRIRTELRMNLLTVKAPNDCNQPPDEAVSSQSLVCFKARLNKHWAPQQYDTFGFI